MPCPDDFHTKYFVQTRQEIDTEKRERDKLLNFAVVILGALGFTFAQSGPAQELLREPYAIAMEAATLAVITSLFWVRRKKLQQIADRWFTLWRMVQHHFPDREDEFLEAVVVKGLRGKRYVTKDVVLNLTLAIPIYCLLFFTVTHLSLHWLLRVLVPMCVVSLHILTSWKILGKGLANPYDGGPVPSKARAPECVGRADRVSESPGSP